MTFAPRRAFETMLSQWEAVPHEFKVSAYIALTIGGLFLVYLVFRYIPVAVQRLGPGGLIALGFLVAGFAVAYSVSLESETTSHLPRHEARTSSPTSGSSPTSSSAAAAPSDWSTSISIDPMTGEKSCYAISRSVGPLHRMEFPYDEVRGWLGVGYDGSTEWAYVGFNLSPNLTDAKTENGYSVVVTRMKWDNRIENVRLTQDWGARFLHFVDDRDAIAKIARSRSVMLELNWYGEGRVHFEFSLTGSAAALMKMRDECSGN